MDELNTKIFPKLINQKIRIKINFYKNLSMECEDLYNTN